MSTVPKARITPREYLERVRVAACRSEYLDGQVYAMAGASYRHNLIVAILVRQLGNRLVGGPCRVVSSDQRVFNEATGLYTYPDVVVACGELRFQDTLLNPTAIVEVLSPSTGASRPATTAASPPCGSTPSWRRTASTSGPTRAMERSGNCATAEAPTTS